jgi:general secretion pathway protein D
VPFLHKIPILGAAFGAKSVTNARTELIILLTPRVIYDENEMVTVSEELKLRLRKLRGVMKGDK